MDMQTAKRRPQVGDWIEARSLYGAPPRRGTITELLGRERHLRYRVRWDEKHESIIYPADGVVVIPQVDAPPTAPRTPGSTGVAQLSLTGGSSALTAGSSAT